MTIQYHFITRMELTSSPQDIWEVLARSEEWADWWRWLRDVEILDEGGEDGTGRRVRHRVSSPLRYELQYIGVVTRAVEPAMSRFEAEGDLVGVGQFRLDITEKGFTLITFDWLVETPKRWMNLLAPLARPVFVWNHHKLMEDFAADLASATGGRLEAVENFSIGPDDEGFFKIPAFNA